jgi:hypothetical protein
MGLVPKRPGELVRSKSSTKFRSLLIAFAVMGLGYKSDLLIVHGPIDNDPYMQNLEDMGFIKKVDANGGQLGWTFQ